MHNTDESLKSIIRRDARDDGRRAWLIMIDQCGESTSALMVNPKVAAIAAITIPKDVGVKESSITDVARLLVMRNEDLPQARRYEPDRITEIFLSTITLPPTLAKEADDLLQAPVADLPTRFYTQAAPGAVPPIVGGWNHRVLVQHFDESWRASFKRGDQGLRHAEPSDRPHRPGPSGRADGMAVMEEGMMEWP